MPGGTIDTWIAGAGAWSDAGDWSFGVPGPADTATFGGSAALDAEYAATGTIEQLLDLANPRATLDLTSGTLSLLGGGTWAGVLLLGAAAEIIPGTTLDLSGAAALDGTLGGPGTLGVSGIADAGGLRLTGSAVLADTGTIIAEGAVTLGTAAADAATLTVAPGATFDMPADISIAAAGNATIVNAGVFAKSGVSGTSFVGASLESTGTITVARGTLSFDGGNDRIGGTIGGSGELDLRGGGSFALASGLALGVGTLAILDDLTTATLDTSPTYAGAFTLGNAALLDLNGDALDLTGGADALLGTIAGPGTVTVAGSADASRLAVIGGAVLSDTGTITEDGVVNLGTGGADAATLAIAPGGSYDLLADVSINGFGSAAVANAGLFEKTGVSGTSGIGADFANAGTIAVTAGTLAFAAALTNDGAIMLGGGPVDAGLTTSAPLAADAGKSGSIVIAAGGTLILGAAVAADQTIDFAGTGGLLELVQPGSVAAAIAGFTAGETIDLPGIAANGFSYANGLLVVSEISNGTLANIATLDLPGIADPAALGLVVDGQGGTAIELAHPGPRFTNPPGTIIADDWTTAAAGDWSNPANWSVAVPGAGSDAVIAPAGTAGFAVGYDATGAVNELSGGTVSSGAAITFAMSGGALTVNDGGTWSGPIVQTAGTLDAVTGFAAGGGVALGTAALDEVDSGILSIGGGVLAGTIGGAGELYLIGGNGFTLEPGFSIAVATFDVGVNASQGAGVTLDTSLTYAGDFMLAGGASLSLNAHNFALAGSAALDGSIVGPGTFAESGIADVNGLAVSGTALLRDGGTITQDGAFTLGSGASDASALQIAAGATWDIRADVGIAAIGAAAIANAGLFEKTGVSGTSSIAGNFASTGTILAGRGTLSFAGGTADSFGGTLGGAGEIDLDTSASLQGGLVLSVATLGLYGGGDVALGGSETFAGALSLGATTTLALSGFALRLNGTAALDGRLQSTGTATIAGTADANGLTLSGSVALADAGLVTQDGDVGLGTAASDAAGLAIAAGATYDILADVNINSVGNATLANAGLLEKTGVQGTSYVFANFSNTGTIAIGNGTLSLRAGTGTLGGTVTGAGELDLNSAGTYTLPSSLLLGVASLGLYGGADIVLGGSRTYDGALTLGAATNLDLNGNALTLGGTAVLDGMLQGAGSATVAGSADANGLVLYGAAALDVSGTLAEDAAVTLGSGADTAVLNIANGGTYDFIADVGLDVNGSAIVNNAGLFEKTGTSGTSTVDVSVSNTGTIAAASGTFAFTGNLTNDGLLSVAGGTLVIGQSLIADGGRSGTIDIGAAGEALLQGAASSAQAIAFTAGSGTLALAEPTRIGGTISGFQTGETIDLVGAAFTLGAETVSFAGNVLAVVNHGTTVASLNFAGSYGQSDFQLAGDGGSGTDITTSYVPCFLAGTQICTPCGEVPVEALRVGENVLTATGAVRPIVWIGERRIACHRHARPEKVLPVRIRAGAFGAHTPRRDLLLSPDHAVSCSAARADAAAADDVLIPVKHLVNGITVRQETVLHADYFHIELSSHDLLLAEGLAVESYFASGNRAEFANAAAHIALPPHPGPLPRRGGEGEKKPSPPWGRGLGEGDHGRLGVTACEPLPDFAQAASAQSCAPLCCSGPALAAMKRRLLAEVERLGYRITTAADLHVVAAGQAIRPVMVEGGLHRFVLPEQTHELHIVSRAGVPAELDAESEDGRRLGVAIQGIVVDGRPVALGDRALGRGFHAPESDGTEQWRWTDGTAVLAIPPGPPVTLDLLVRASMRSWLEPASETAQSA